MTHFVSRGMQNLNWINQFFWWNANSSACPL